MVYYHLRALLMRPRARFLNVCARAKAITWIAANERIRRYCGRERWEGAALLVSDFMAGFECSAHRRRDGRRLDLIAGTGHDRCAEQDYRLLTALRIRSMRDGLRWHLIEPAPGRYDWSSVLPMLAAARNAGVQVIWDFSIMAGPTGSIRGAPIRWRGSLISPCGAIDRAGRLLHPDQRDQLSELGGGDVGYLNPFGIDRGEELKLILCRAAIAATARFRSADPRADLHRRTLIHVAPINAEPDQIERAASYFAAQHDAIEILLGRRLPELGGSAAMVDVVGVNHYPHNQFTADRETIERGDDRRVCMRELLVAAHARLGLPMIVAKTGCEGEERPDRLAYVAGEVRAANTRGADVRGSACIPSSIMPDGTTTDTAPTGCYAVSATTARSRPRWSTRLPAK